MTLTAAQAHVADAQRTARARAQAHVAGRVRQAFSPAKRQVRPALVQLAGAYDAELAKVRELSDDDAARVPLTWLRTTGGLATVRSAFDGALYEAGRASCAAVVEGQHRAEQAGIDLALAHWPGARHRMLSPRRLGVSGYDGAPLAVYFDRLAPRAWRKASKRAYTDTSSGKDGRQLESDLADVLDWAEDAALLVAGTEIAWLMWAALLNSADQGWVWDAAPDACPICADLNGSEYDAGEEFVPAHPKCYCQPIPRADVLAVLSFAS